MSLVAVGAIVLSMCGTLHLFMADGHQYDATNVQLRMISNQPSGPFGKLIICHSV